MDLKECYEKGHIKKARPSKERAKSLIEVADIKEKTVKSAVLDASNINAYFPMSYDALREVMEALCILHGYKVANHVCIGELLASLIPDFDFLLFDRFRYARNGINYYGEKIDFEQGKAMITNMFAMKKKLTNELERMLKQ